MNLYPPIYQTASGTPRDLSSLLALKSQGFGDNPQIYGRFIVPLPGGGFGPMFGHNGLDWPCNTGTPIYASHDGKVSNQIDSDAGKGVVLTTQGFKTIYWHLDSYAQTDGTQVKRGDIIGYSDNTGFSTGPHLHFGLKLLDANGNVLDRDNGYDGAISPEPFLIWPDEINKTMDKDFITYYYLAAFNRLPDDGEMLYWLGKPHVEIVKATIRDREKLLVENLPK